MGSFGVLAASATSVDLPDLDFRGMIDASPNPYLVLDRDLNIAFANRAYLQSVRRDLSDLVGRWAWEAFPTDPETERQAIASFERVKATGQPDTMALLRFDVPRPEAEGGGLELRWWSITHSPVLDAAGQVSLIVQHPIDVTELEHLHDAVSAGGEAEAIDLRPAQTGIFTRAQRVYEANLALKAESDRLRELFAQAPSFMAVLRGPEHVFEQVNAAYLQLIGHRNVVGCPVHEALPEVESQGVLDLLDEVYRTGKAFVGRATPLSVQPVRGAAVEERFVDFLYQPITGPDGACTGIFVEGSDVTEHVRAKAALRESEERYRTLFEAIEAGFCVTEVRLDDGSGRADYRVVEANPAFYEQTGFPQAILGQWLREAAPALEEHWYETYARVARTGAPVRFEQGSDHLGRWFDVHAFRATEPHGENRTGRVAILFTDISERRRAEDRLRDLNETLEARVAETLAERQVLADIFDHSTAATMALDNGYIILAVNNANMAALERVYGKRPKVGDNLLDLLADMPEHRAQVAATWARALAGEEFAVVDMFGDEAHERVTFDVRFSVLRDRGGRQIGATSTAYDISDRVRAQAELEAAQEQLRQSQKMEAMGQLTGGVAHDFNNLLTPIIASLDMLLRRGLGSERERRLMDGALQSAERAKVLVQRLLAFARRQPLQPVAVDVGALVTGMAGLIGSTLGPRVELGLDLAPDLPPARADANQLEMALLNLAVNARDAMPEGGSLTLAASRESVRSNRTTGLKLGHYVRLAVTDTGTGMDEATLARAAEPFFSTKGIGRGTGLGLSMVHGLAAQLGGGLRIRSAPGQGTTVELWLPISAEAMGTVREVAVPRQEGQEQGRALLVDDEDLVRMSTADMLTDLGYEVLEAGSAEEALRLLGEGLVPDLLVTDHLMPGMTGADLAREVRALRPEMPVLIVSGYAEVEGVAPDLPRLVKPFRAAELAERLARLGSGAATTG